MAVGTPRTVEIRKGWYFTAGKKWGWEEDGLDCFGVGINQSFLDGCDRLRLKVEGNEYEIGVAELKAFVNKYKSFYKMPGGSIIGVVSRGILEKI